MKNQYFDCTVRENCMFELKHPQDEYHMNWIEGATPWGTVCLPDGLSCEVERFFEEDQLVERYTFHNEMKFPIFTNVGDIGIYTTINDDYLAGANCLTHRCHAHIWCGGSASHICALRMGGTPPHLGLKLTRGAIQTYSVERDLEKQSNDRGDFILHPIALDLQVDESYVVEWVLFWHGGKDDFYNRLKMDKNYLSVHATRYILFEEEVATIRVDSDEEVFINQMKQRPAFQIDAHQAGVTQYYFQQGEAKTWLEILTLPLLDELVEARTHYIVEKQQYHHCESPLDGAYLAYHTKHNVFMYAHDRHDRNGGRERVGMGVLIARSLQRKKDVVLQKSLEKYMGYVLRELFDEETGMVFNDIGRNNDWDRLYNYPWFATFFLEYYRLTGKVRYLKNAYGALMNYYHKGGCEFYAIDIPMREMIEKLEKEGMQQEANLLLLAFIEHGEYLLRAGQSYKAHEVNYEQSIVAPATWVLLELAHLTKEDRFLNAAKEQMGILELFNGRQPDYHLHEVALRHWDGYWFGASEQYGDTFPHYWSSLTGNAFFSMYQITGDESWKEKTEASLRASLSLFSPDGSASCACVYPFRINGQPGARYDALANDQDWALYYYLRYQDAHPSSPVK